MKQKWIIGSIMMLVVAFSPFANAKSILEDEPKIQIAILIDNSGSMDGLINQARTYLWQVVSDCALAKKGGVKPKFEVALYHYGDNRLSSKDGYIKQLSPFTDDLDLISEKLFKLDTSGGEEFCGQVVMQTVNELKWSRNPNDLKMIFIAGNEPFTQGPVKYRDACKAAITKGITVNTILCGNWGDDGWKDAALLADGDSLKLDHDSAIVSIPTPFDERIKELNTEFNNTYISYGATGKRKQETQVRADNQVMELNNPAIASRASMKISQNYSNASWDLVDATKDKSFDISKVKESELPENMKKMSLAERKKYVVEMSAKRENLRKELDEQLTKQQAFIAEESKKQSINDKDNLGQIMIQSTRKQALKRGISFEENK